MNQSYLYIVLVIVGFLILFLIVILIKQNKSDETPMRIRRNHRKKKGIASGMAMGLGIGMAIGAAMDNMGVGIAIGVAIGSSMGVTFDSVLKKQEDPSQINPKSRYSYSEPQHSKNKLTIGIMMVLLGILFLGFLLFFNLK